MQENVEVSNEIPVACSLTESEKEVRGEELFDLFSRAEETSELTRGYALRFPSDAGLAGKLVDAILKERECCPFFEFTLEFEPANGSIRLSIEGPEGTRQLLGDLLIPRPASVRE